MSIVDFLGFAHKTTSYGQIKVIPIITIIGNNLCGMEDVAELILR